MLKVKVKIVNNKTIAIVSVIVNITFFYVDAIAEPAFAGYLQDPPERLGKETMKVDESFRTAILQLGKVR